MLGAIHDYFITSDNLPWLFVCVAFLLTGWVVLELLSLLIGPLPWDKDEDFYE